MKADDNWDNLSGATGRLIYRLLANYFERPVTRIRTGEYVPGKVYEFYSAPAALYRKKKAPVGYVKAADVFSKGEVILIRMLEEPFLIDDKSPWQPKVYRYSNREARLLTPSQRHLYQLYRPSGTFRSGRVLAGCHWLHGPVRGWTIYCR